MAGELGVKAAVRVLRRRGPDSWLWRRALETVLEEAAIGRLVALRAATEAAAAHGGEPVWRAWLQPWLSGPSPGRWSSPLVAALLDAGTPVPDAVLAAAWRDWLEEPDPALWSLLRRWDRPAPPGDAEVWRLSVIALGDDLVPVSPRELAEAAARFDHPVGEAARDRLLRLGDPQAVEEFCAAAVGLAEAVAFCRAHQLAPADEVGRALFFVLTGQLDQYRALDPEGDLLALGYEGASPEERVGLRDAMTGLGAGDVLRVLAGRHTGPDGSSLTDQERLYLAERLTERGDWDRLWRLTTGSPLADAVDTVRSFGDWRPAGGDDRRVFEALLAADPDAVRDACRELTSGFHRHMPAIRVWLTDAGEQPVTVHALDFAPDGSRLAFAGRAAGPCAGVVDLADMTLHRLHTGLPHPARLVAHLDSGGIVVAGGGRISRADDDWVLELTLDAVKIAAVARIAGDRAFVVVAQHGRPGQVPAWTVFASESGRPLARGDALHDLGHTRPGTTAVDPDGRLVAVVGDGMKVVADLAAPQATATTLQPPASAKYGMRHAALSPSALIATCAGHLHMWHDPLTSEEPPLTAFQWAGRNPAALSWSPALGRFLAVTHTRLELLDVPPTREDPLPGTLRSEQITLAGSRRRPRAVRLSPAGDVLAVAGGLDEENAVDLYPVGALGLGPVLDRPMGRLTHDDLGNVLAIMDNPALDEETRATLELLRTCLEHRFRHDVGLGHAAAATAAAARGDDIALATESVTEPAGPAGPTRRPTTEGDS